jgi:hypothetical protein
MLGRTLAAFLLAFTSIQARDLSALDPLKQTVSISLDTSVLGGLVKLGSDTHTPIGIVLDAGKPDKFCGQNRKVTVRDKPVADVLDDLLTQSNYVWSLDGGVIVIRPAHVSDQAGRVLNIKFDRFGGMQTTMQGLGIILAGWIYSRLHPGAGVAGDILSSPDAEQYPQLGMRNASAEEILNQIVSLGSKGIWLFRLSQNFEHNKNVDIYTYSYKDDAHALQTICSALDSGH